MKADRCYLMVESKTNINNFSLKISDSLSNFNSLKIGRECARKL